jgi:hypothetical protein
MGDGLTMNKEHDDYLVTTYPILFQERNASIMQTPMGFGFECGDGWFKLLDDASRQLEFLNNLSKEHNLGYEVVAAQVKEKFGTLRFYLDFNETEEAKKEDGSTWYDIVHSIIRATENRSEVTCEDCGKRGQTKSHGGWYATLCEEHSKAYDERRAKK